MEKCVSPYNLKGIPPACSKKSVFICDVTLRDGEQTAGVSFSLEEKIHAAAMLDEIGVGQIQTGGINTEEDYAVAKALCRLERHNAKIETMSSAFSKDWKDQILKAIDVGSDVVHTLIPLSPHMRGMFKSKPDDAQIFEHTAETIEFMRAKGVKNINISLLDATRSPECLITKMAEVLSHYKVERMRFADTVGVANPLCIYYMTHLFLKTFEEQGSHRPFLGVHLHDDFGLATANALAAVAAGADYIDLSVNGLGERSGNPDLAQVVMSLEALCGVNTGIKTEKLYDVSRYFEEISGIPVPSNKPLVGAWAFSDETDVHALASFNDPFAYQGIKPDCIGNHRVLIPGKKNGIDAIRLKMQALGLDEGADSVVYKHVLDKVRQESAGLRGKVMSDGRFAEIVMETKNSR